MQYRAETCLGQISDVGLHDMSRGQTTMPISTFISHCA